MNINNPSSNQQTHSCQEGQQNNTSTQGSCGTDDNVERMTEMTEPTAAEAPGRAEVNTNDEDIAQAQEGSR